MLKIDKKNNIFLTRGDSARFTVSIEDVYGTPYEMKAGDKLKFTLRKRTVAESEVLISKTCPAGRILIKPSDTCELDYGVYWYDVQLETSLGDIHTVIPPRQFVIVEEVTI